MIDFTFIAALEGSTKEGCVPDAQNSMSGVTIGCGFDIGQRSEQEIRATFEQALADKLVIYSGLKKESAVNKLTDVPLKISSEEEAIINSACHAEAERRLKRDWANSDAVVSFESLATACQTVIASVAFQYGHLATKTPNFWRQVTQLDWHAALDNLRNFGDRYPTRRNKEADLLASYIESF